MSSSRFGKWADADEDEDDEDFDAAKPGATSAFLETKADESGIRLAIDYIEKDGKTFKRTRRLRTTTITSYTNEKIIERKTMKKFGKAATNDPTAEKNLIVRAEEEIPIELSKKMAVNVHVKDEAEEKFYEESLAIAEGMSTVKKSWTEINRSKQVERDGTGAERPPEPDKPSEMTATTTVAPGAPAAGTGGPRTYVPPSLRGKDGAADPKGKGKGKFDPQQQQEQSLRVTNLSDDVKEGDLQDLFSAVGRLQRVYLAKDDLGNSRGFAFITYYSREDALRAIKKLHGFGYDNLILQVMFAKPRT